jgi:hypothetical protein
MSQAPRPKVAMVLVPGYGAGAPGFAMQRLASALSAIPGVSPPRRTTVAGDSGVRLALDGQDSFDLDLVEVSWADLRRPADMGSPIALLARTPRQVAYWASGLLNPETAPAKAGRVVRRYFRSLAVTAGVTIVWILIILALVAGELFKPVWELFFSNSASPPQATTLTLAVTLLVGLGVKDWIASQLLLSEYMRSYLSSSREGTTRAVVRNRLRAPYPVGTGL